MFLRGFTGFCCFLRGFTGFYWVFSAVTGFYLVFFSGYRVSVLLFFLASGHLWWAPVVSDAARVGAAPAQQWKRYSKDTRRGDQKTRGPTFWFSSSSTCSSPSSTYNSPANNSKKRTNLFLFFCRSTKNLSNSRSLTKKIAKKITLPTKEPRQSGSWAGPLASSMLFSLTGTLLHPPPRRRLRFFFFFESYFRSVASLLSQRSDRPMGQGEGEGGPIRWESPG